MFLTKSGRNETSKWKLLYQCWSEINNKQSLLSINCILLGLKKQCEIQSFSPCESKIIKLKEEQGWTICVRGKLRTLA